jgi:hypothetical protein
MELTSADAVHVGASAPDRVPGSLGPILAARVGAGERGNFTAPTPFRVVGGLVLTMLGASGGFPSPLAPI